MTIKRINLALAAVAALTFSSYSSALILPLTVGADAGLTDVSYKGRSGTGFTWGLTGNLKLNDYSSIYSGYSETTADIPDTSGVDQDFKSISVPLALQLNLPLLLGDVYVRGGGNYYENTYLTEKEDGFGVMGAVGISLTPAIGPGFAVEIGYQDRGNADTSTVSAGVKLNF